MSAINRTPELSKDSASPMYSVLQAEFHIVSTVQNTYNLKQCGMYTVPESSELLAECSHHNSRETSPVILLHDNLQLLQ